MQDFYFLVRSGLVLIYVLKVCAKNPLRFYWEKIFSVHYLHISFNNVYLLKFFERFLVENLETTPSTFLSNSSTQIYLSRIINHWSIIFTLYLMWRASRLVCALLVFFAFLSFSFFSFSISIFLDRH